MKLLYSITNWDEHYENNRTRGMKVMQWVPVPNKHDGEGFVELLSQPNGTTLYGAWHLILQVASKCKKRGVLAKDNGVPHDAQSIAAKTRGSLKAITEALEVCTRIGWITATEWSDSTSSDPALCPQSARSLPAVCPHPTEEEEKGREGIEKKEENPLPPTGGLLDEFGETEDTKPTSKAEQVPHKQFVEAWNQLGQPFKRILDWTDKRKDALRVRWGDATFREHWQRALEVMKRTSWANGNTERRWVADVDWFLKPGKALKFIEQDQPQARPVSQLRVGVVKQPIKYNGAPI